MPYDLLLMFSQAQAVTATAVSTDTVDLGAPSVNPRSPTGALLRVNHGGGEPHPIVAKIGVTFLGLTSLQINLQSSPDDVTFTTISSTDVIPLARLTAGSEFGFSDLPIRMTDRYLRLQYVVVGTGTAGNITAGFSDGFQTNGVI
ncbi:MAG: Bbp16 family capsid cement protein [Beijerinckiaceae bacterium]